VLRERPSNPRARGCRYEWALTSSLALGRAHGAGNKTGRVKQDPARTTVSVRKRECTVSRRGNAPWTSSSHRSHRSHRSLSSRSRNGSDRSRPTRQPSRPPGFLRCFPCRRRRMSTSSRQRFLPRRGRLRDAAMYSGTTDPSPVRWSLRKLRPPRPTKRRRSPKRGRPYSDAFAWKPVSHSTFIGLPYVQARFYEWHAKRTIIRIGLHSQYAKPITLKVGRNCLVP
jgi:hypothetical protein